ncbi:hypothetical protein BDN72DRAFT_304458 [Pluteus cervinus]|uniref:Uncharacterized protein n=1 Tax=Pluteus cervinus TaxID=181527 RepID=A0ACD3B4V3_9AGAR|nr:hypothetical protein BDN72DRAFT_304458 [Pluteus cervinus]
MSALSGSRIALYSLLWICAAILLGLTASRIHFTRGFGFYGAISSFVVLTHIAHRSVDPIIVELLVTACLFVIWAPIAICLLLLGAKTLANIADMIALFVLWVMTLVGAAIASHFWHGLGFCWRFRACKVLSAVVSFAWITWAVATILLILAMASMGSKDDTPGYTRRGGRGRNQETRAAGDQHVTTGAAPPATSTV